MSNTESNGNRKPANPAGLYRHPESGAEVIVQATPKYGSPMADGVVRVGYVYVGPAPVVKEAEKSPKTETK